MSFLKRFKNFAVGAAEEQAALDERARQAAAEDSPPVLNEVVNEGEAAADNPQHSAEVVALRPGVGHIEEESTSQEASEAVSLEEERPASLSGEEVTPPAEPATPQKKTAVAILRPGNEPTIEAAAEELLQELGKVRFPVEYEKLVDALHLTLGLFDPVNKESLRNVSAAYVPVSRHIWINVRDPESRRRFTAAHMLGKAVNAPRDRVMAYRDTVMSDDISDIIANRFAMAVLMPETDFVSAYDDADGDVTRLADKFGVPRQIVRRRIRSLRLERVEAEETGQDGVGDIIESLVLPSADEPALEGSA